MLSKNARFSREELITAKRGKSLVFPYGTVRLVSSPSPKAAVVVSKKVFKTAVRRNKVRRRVYAILSHIQKEKTLAHGLVIYPNNKAEAASFAELKAALLSVLG